MKNNPFAEAMLTLGTPGKTGANQSFTMAHLQSVWYVTKGHIDLFSVRLENDQPSGSRFFLFTASQGELLFGMRSDQFGNEQALLAVPSTDAEIIVTGIDQVKELIKRPGFFDTGVSLIETWIGHLLSGISKDLNSRTDVMIDSDTVFTLEDNMKFRSKKGLFWVEFLSGNALFLGMREIRDNSERKKFPVSQDSWLQTTESSDIRSCKTGELLLQDDFWDHMENFYQVIFYCDFLNTNLMTVDEFNRLSEKAVHDSNILSASLFKIASVINDNIRKTYIEAGVNPLVSACKAVAGYAGISVTLPPRPKSDDAPPLTLNDIAHASRFRTRKVRLAGDWWNKDNGPLLAFTRDSDFPIALIPKSPGKYEYISPAENLKQLLTAESASLLAAEARQFYRPFPDRPIKVLDLIRFSFKNSIRDIMLMILVGVAGGILTILVPMLTGTIFDSVIPKSDYTQLYVYALALFFSFVAIAIFQLVRSFSMIRIETKLDFLLQSAIWDRLLNLPVPFFRKYQAGELAAKANSIMMLRKILSDTVIYSVLGSVFLVFNFILMFFYDASLSLYILGFSLLSYIFIFFVGKKIQKRQYLIIQLNNKIFGMLLQLLSSISKIKIAGAEIHAFSQWAEKYATNKRQTYEVRKLNQWISLLTTLWPLLITIFVFATIAWQVPHTLSTGEFLAFYTAMTTTIASFLQLGMAGIALFMAMPLLENIRPILETLPENVSLKAEIKELSGEIEVNNVSFRYQPDGPLVLDNVSLQVQPGEFVAIVGTSGSGKSTLLRLLLGFETPESGSVYYDRQDLSTFDPASVRRQAGTVLQQTQLAPGNILTNITGVTDATFEDAWEAARSVGLDEDIKQMPMGMYTVITGGLSTISGGQKQRIMIARAIVNRPRILFFDEATSSLDNKTQFTVSASLEKLQASRVVIAHRLTTVQHADRIYVMDHGKIVESGSFAELIETGGKFNELVKRQMVE
ncbi:MAG: NHLP bacteriocin export ABC transporter permease/ATPase subunit [Bacteroidota bacterium]